MFMGLAKLRSTLASSDPVMPAPARDLQQRLWRAVQAPAPTAFLARFAVLNRIGAALLGAAWAEGLLLKPYQGGSSRVCYLITALFGWVLICCLRQDSHSVRGAGK